MCRSAHVGLLAVAVVAVVLAPAAAAESDGTSDELSARRQQRMERLQAEREQRRATELRSAAGSPGAKALSSSTFAGRPSPQAVPNATDVDLDIDGDFDLGGFVFKDGVPFVHNDGGATYMNTAVGLNALTSATLGVPYPALSGGYNTALGFDAVRSTTAGFSNTGLGANALRANTTGFWNTASGAYALFANTGGGANTSVGLSSLFNNSTGFGNTATGALAMANFSGTYGSGDYNTASGYRTMYGNDTGNLNTAIGAFALATATAPFSNTAVGYRALVANTGSLNTAIGINAGQSWTTGQDNIAIGTGAYGVAGETGTIRIGGGTLYAYQTRTYIQGIRNALYPPGYYFDQTVCTNVFNQLGPCGGPSSARFKNDIQEMEAVSQALDSLEPVTFHYKKRELEADGPPHYGLIAEEVAEVFPHVVRYDDEGKPHSIRYELLTPMLLKELQDEKQRRETEVEDLRKQLADLRKVVADLTRREEIQRE